MIDESYVPDEKMYIVLNNGVENTGAEDTGVYPNALEIQYIRLYKNQDTVFN